MTAPTPRRAPRETWTGLILRTFFICLAIIAVGSVGLYFHFERLGTATATSGNRAAALAPAFRPPQMEQVLIHVSTDGHTLRPQFQPGAAHSPRSEQIALIVENALLSTAEGLGHEIPFTPLAVYEADGLAVVDLAREETADTLDFRAECLLAYAIVNSLADNFDDIHAVRFLLDGAPADTLAGALDISTPLVPNVALHGGAEQR